MKLLILFIVLNVANVIIQTIKSICTIKCGKVMASIVNAIAYGLYTVVLVYMVCDLPLWAKVVVVGGANLIGVYIVKLIEEKTRKDKLWKIECTCPIDMTTALDLDLKNANISHNFVENVGQNSLFNIYSKTQKDSQKIKKLLDQYQVKYFVTESKIL
jgi:uncharacterized protein YebE (UPF0316 family)